MITILRRGGLANDYGIPWILGYYIRNIISIDLTKIQIFFHLVRSLGGGVKNPRTEKSWMRACIQPYFHISFSDPWKVCTQKVQHDQQSARHQGLYQVLCRQEPVQWVQGGFTAVTRTNCYVGKKNVKWVHGVVTCIKSCVCTRWVYYYYL